MAQQVKPPLETPISECLGLSPASASQLSALWKVANDGSSFWVTATHREDADWVPGSWLWPGPALAIVGIWGVNQWVDDILHPAPPSVK